MLYTASIKAKPLYDSLNNLHNHIPGLYYIYLKNIEAYGIQNSRK